MNTNAANLDRLHDIIVPAPVSRWPPAPGWYWILGFAVLFLSVALLKGMIRSRHNRYRREALTGLTRLETMLRNPSARPRVLLLLSELLKRTALTAFGRESVATLTGPDWFRFLDDTARTNSFSNGLGSLLENAIHDPRMVATLDELKLRELIAAIRHWIKHHQIESEQKDANQLNHESSKPLLPSLERSC